MPINIKKYILLFAGFFMLLYSENINVGGGMKISQLWKMPLMAYLVYYVFQYRKKASPDWTQVSYWLSLKHLINGQSCKSLVSNIQDGITFLFLPLMYNFFQNVMNKATMDKCLLCVCQFFILTNVPFLFFGMKSNHESLDYGSFQAFSGIFQNQHAMSIIMAICILVLLHNFKRGVFDSKVTKAYNVFLIVLGAYAMYLGFARTGWVMCAIGICILFFPKGMQVKQWAGIVFIGIALSGGFTYMMITNKAFHDRILDINSNTGKQKELGSGRGELIANAFELYFSGNCFELACGHSMAGLKEYENKKIGKPLFAHNGFVTLLATDGAVGLLLEFLSMFLLLRFIIRRRECSTYRLSIATWVMNVAFQMTQGGHIFHYDLLYAMIYGILQFEYEQQRNMELSPTDIDNNRASELINNEYEQG